MQQPEAIATGAEIPVDLLKVSGLSHADGTLYLASIRERVVAALAPGATTARVVVAYPHPVADVAPAQDGLWLVAGGGQHGRQCVLWSTTLAREVRSFDCPGGAGGGLAFHRGRLWLTHRHDRRLYVLDPATGDVERMIATEHEIFSPSTVEERLWIVEAKTGPFGRFSPKDESTFFFARLDAAEERPSERLAAPEPPSAMTTDGRTFWYAPRARPGLVAIERAALVPVAS